MLLLYLYKKISDRDEIYIYASRKRLIEGNSIYKTIGLNLLVLRNISIITKIECKIMR